tara:strand:- start:136 stop:327 length:192 start_codon:yes stop_codon:yes gene_type:complete
MDKEEKNIELQFKDKPPDGILKKIRFLPDNNISWRVFYELQCRVIKLAEQLGIRYIEVKDNAK